MFGLEFIDSNTDLSLSLIGQYNYFIVLCSYIVAWIGAYAGLSTIPPIRFSPQKNVKTSWRILGAIAMGIAIWSMHFAGMIAYYLPVHVSHDLLLTSFSIVPAIGASYLAISFIEKDDYTVIQLVSAGVFLGAGIGAMHYIGMEAMLGDFNLVYDPLLFLLSVVVAVVLAIFALNVGKFRTKEAKYNQRYRLAFSSASIGAAITGMHYVGMQASYFLSTELTHSSTQANSHTTMMIILIAATIFLSSVAVVSTIIHKMFRKLYVAKNKAEASAQAKADFLANMSHEIRTPMNGVIGMLDLLFKTKLNTDQHHKANIARSSAYSLLSLINDILDFSKVEAGQLDLEYLHFDLRALMVEFIQTFILKAEEKGLEIILDITHIEHTMVIGDPNRLRQVLSNLMSNAIKFTEQGEIIVRGRLMEEKGGKLNFSCAIHDSGIGIPKASQKHLFDLFTQVDSSTTRKYGGTGLGLSIVKKLCQLMDGNIFVSSKVGKGSCFEFNISLESSDQSQRVVPKVDVSNLSILVLDDNATNREVFRGQLEHWGCKVTEAESAPIALSLLKQNIKERSELFDIIFVDMQMPEMSGVTFAKKVRINPVYNDIALIMMTSMARKGDENYFANIGFSGYFSKPVSGSDILDAITLITTESGALDRIQPLITSRYISTLAHEQSDQSVSEIPKTVVENNDGFTAKVLLVEDNRINMAVATIMLKDLGLEVVPAVNGVEAITTLVNSMEGDKFALVLMDCQMPIMDGYQATKEIRSGSAGEFYSNIPIIAMTANAMKGDREKCLISGMNDYVSKPINEAFIIEVLEKWLDDNIYAPLKNKSLK